MARQDVSVKATNSSTCASLTSSESEELANALRCDLDTLGMAGEVTDVNLGLATGDCELLVAFRDATESSGEDGEMSVID